MEELLEYIKTHLGLEPTDPSEDDPNDNLLIDYMQEAIEFIELELASTIIKSERITAFYVDEDDSQKIPLIKYLYFQNPTTITSFERKGLLDDNWTVLDLPTIEKMYGLYFISLINPPIGYYKMEMDNGWLVQDLPADLKRILVEFVYIRCREMGVVMGNKLPILHVNSSVVNGPGNIAPTQENLKDMRSKWKAELQKYIWMA